MTIEERLHSDDWIYAARERIYQEIKDMTPEEEIEYLHRETDPIIKQFGFRTVKNASEVAESAPEYGR